MRKENLNSNTFLTKTATFLINTTAILASLVFLAPTTLVDDHRQNLYAQTHNSTGISAQFSRAAHRLAQHIKRRINGFTPDKGWTCFSGEALQENLPELHEKLSLTQMGQSTLKTLINHDIGICVAPDNTFNKRFPTSGGSYYYYYNAMFLTQSDATSISVGHEKTHGGQDIATGGLTQKLETEGKFPAAMQCLLLGEAGSVATEVFLASEEYRNGDDTSYNSPRMQSTAYTHLLNKFNKILWNNPSDHVLQKSEVIDKIAAEFLKSKSPKAWVGSYSKRHARTYAKMPDKSKADFEPMNFTMEDVRKLVTGDDFPEGTPLPETYAAFKNLEKQLKPFMIETVTQGKNDAQIDKMAEDFVSNLAEQPHRYQTAQNTDKWAATPSATPKSTL